MKRLALITVLLFGVGILVTGCAEMQAKPSTENFKAPGIKLEAFEVPQYDGYWYFAGTVEPTKGVKGDRGAPLPLSFLFSVTNQNPYPVLLEGYTFTVAFEKDFDVVTCNNQDSVWVPAGKTTQVRATTMITARSAFLSLMATGGYKLKERKMDAWGALEKWWKGVPEYTVPVTIKEGAFSFKADGLSKVVPFEATFP